MNSNLKTKIMESNDLLRKGETVIYEGNEAELIRVKPFLVIKLDNRVLCGALHKQIEPLKESNIHNQTL